MEENVKKELEEFQNFKKQFVFVQKEIVQEGENLYCDGELLQQGEEKPIGITDK
ncbi:MAG: hypothetical protein IJ867_03390 [Clostridia bacterium]|nr:hypothetical protein [Clostridia bacterium]MBR2289656.1 hypothetical protein [Clostridia bacterium]